MALSVWLGSCGRTSAELCSRLAGLLQAAGVLTGPMPPVPDGEGLVVLDEIAGPALDLVRDASRSATVLAIALTARGLDGEAPWTLLRSGAADVLVWRELPRNVDDVVARVARWHAIRDLAESPRVCDTLVGRSGVWRRLLSQVIEVAAFTDLGVLVTGESGTGKELVARLIHDLDPRERKGELVTVDCTTLTPELAGSELFGHERGAFTGAMAAREGAFELANGGTLFLDEIGELPLPLQAQLLRVIQEGTCKRVGSNVWQHTAFRLVCATNRELEAEVERGRFRGDLYYRIAGWICRTPPLSERREDILPLAQHFLAQAAPDAPLPQFDDAVRKYLLARDYPGNVRELRRVVARLRSRHAGSGPITIGDIPLDERPADCVSRQGWLDEGFRSAIDHAIEMGLGLREISQGAAETAIRLALDHEDGNLHRAACRLGVTDRALQLRRANNRQSH